MEQVVCSLQVRDRDAGIKSRNPVAIEVRKVKVSDADWLLWYLLHHTSLILFLLQA